MTEIRFYHLLQDTTAKAVPEILGKALERGMKILLKLPDEERVKYYDDWLWRFKPESFLPHGMDGDKFPERQPVWISSRDDAPNIASMAVILEEAEMPPIENFELVCLMFDNENKTRLQRARSLWGQLKEQPELVLTYWKQQENGAWKKQEI
ncbi:MAG: polymerase subunit chi [Alphaproteobacteria bacterium]|nr:polymerase subunit chi [Alphaproteobacteria bacterium]